MSGIIICPICLEKFGDPPIEAAHEIGNASFNSNQVSALDCSVRGENGNEMKVTPCGHIYHGVCLTNWLEGGSDCPTCRMSIIDLSQVITVYPQFSSLRQILQIPTHAEIQAEHRNQICDSLASIQTIVCSLEEEIRKTSSKLMLQFSLLERNKTVSLNAVDRIADILRKKPKGETSLEREIVELKESLEDVNKEMNEYGEKVGTLTSLTSGTPNKDKKEHKQLVDSLARINRLVNESKVLSHALEKKVFQLKAKETLLLLNEECNRISTLANYFESENALIKSNMRTIHNKFREIKMMVEKVMENFVSLQSL